MDLTRWSRVLRGGKGCDTRRATCRRQGGTSTGRLRNPAHVVTCAVREHDLSNGIGRARVGHEGVPARRSRISRIRSRTRSWSLAGKSSRNFRWTPTDRNSAEDSLFPVPCPLLRLGSHQCSGCIDRGVETRLAAVSPLPWTSFGALLRSRPKHLHGPSPVVNPPTVHASSGSSEHRHYCARRPRKDDACGRADASERSVPRQRTRRRLHS